ncbi:MAG: cupin domain-containing protein [Pseudomonadota bacterium]
MSTAFSSPNALLDRYVRYGDLRPCTTAFIDTRTPGSAQKENFTIIGPGVSENPDQHVHIPEPHGFNIGAARQPPRCTNSQHSHETAEVFFIHSGTWAFMLGENADEGTVVLQPGDTISIPIHVFRGFENVGDETGIIYAVLGEDDPGQVTWAPYVFDRAAEYGLILLENGALVDTTKGETVPDGLKAQPPTTRAQCDALNKMSADDLLECVVRRDAVNWQPSCAGGEGVFEGPVIGSASSDEQLPEAPLNWLHGFHLRRIRFDNGGHTAWHTRAEAEVVIVHAGEIRVSTRDGDLTLAEGDVLTVPVGLKRKYEATGNGSEIVVVRGTDQPSGPQFED